MAFLLGVVFAVLTVKMDPAAGQIREGAKTGDYCLTESFQGSCSEDEVIMMDEAQYGRMSLGRCVKTDFGFVGCATDVLGLADTRCSGRRRCVIRVPDPLFEDTRPCNEEFKSYLKASYSCVRVVPPQARRCQMSQPLKVVAQSGYLASVVTEESGCGAESAPWSLHALPGQRLNVSLYDYARVGATGGAGGGRRGCVKYAYLRDDATGEPIDVCGGGERRKHVYTSVTSRLQVHILKNYAPTGKRYFVLHYEAIGCPDLVPPRGSWVRREGEVVLMGCSDSDDVFRLTCTGHTWQGKRPNCTTDDPNGATSVLGVLSLPVGAAITLILAIAVGVSALILLAGLLIIKKRRSNDKNTSRRTPNPSILMADGTLRRVKDDPRSTNPRPDTTKTPYSRQSLPSHPNDNEYAYVWETNHPSGQQQPHPCGYCAENCTLNAHDMSCGHYGLPCSSATMPPPGGESMYEKSTYSSGGGRGYNARHGHHDGAAPQYFELDPEVLPKGAAPGRDTLPASLPGGLSSSLRKYHSSTEGHLDMQGREMDEQNRMNFMSQHVAS